MGTMMSVPYSVDECTSIFDIRDINSSFALGSIRVMYTGPNRNGSSFTKDSVQSALPSLRNVPIVCHYDFESNEIGGHDIEVVSSKSGDTVIRNLTSPIGVVPETAKFKFEVLEDDSGTKHEYLVVDGVILWKRQDAYSHIVNDLGGKVSHSMEINVKSGYNDTRTGTYAINDFEFTALCLLENAQPCFQGSALQMFSIDDIKEQMEQMAAEIRDIKELFISLNASDNSQEIDIEKLNMDNYHSEEEGGETVLDEVYEEKLKLLEEYGLNIDELDFAIADYSIDELKTKIDEIVANRQDEPEKVNEYEDASEDAEGTYELNTNLYDNINEAISGIETISTPFGEEPRYAMIDFDSEKSAIYVIDFSDWHMYGFAYELNGDSVDINVESKARVKWAIVDYDEGEQTLPFSEMFERANKKIAEYAESVKALTEEKSAIEEKYSSACDDMSSLMEEVSGLRQFKADTEHAIVMAQIQDVFSQFKDLEGVEAFEALKECAEEFDIETLEEKCFAIRGRNNTAAKFSYESKVPKIIVTHNENRDSDDEKKPYGGIVEYYESKHN